jgi:hypothetical protein
MTRMAAGRRACQQHGGVPATLIVPEGGEIIMYPDSLSAEQLAIMAVVVTASLAAWLIAVFLAARQPRRTSAAANTGPREEETGATAAQLTSDVEPADKAAA